MRNFALVRHTSIDSDRVGLQRGDAGDFHRLCGHLENRNALAFRERHGGRGTPDYRVVGRQRAVRQDGGQRNRFAARRGGLVGDGTSGGDGVGLQRGNAGDSHRFGGHLEGRDAIAFGERHSGRGAPRELVVAGQRAVRQGGGQRDRLATGGLGLVRHAALDRDRVGLQSGNAGDRHRLGGHLEGRIAFAFRERHGGFRTPYEVVVRRQRAVRQGGRNRHRLAARRLGLVRHTAIDDDCIDLLRSDAGDAHCLGGHLEGRNAIAFRERNRRRGTPSELVVRRNRAIRQNRRDRDRRTTRRLCLVRHTSIGGDRVGLQRGDAGDFHRLGGHLEGRNAIAFGKLHCGNAVPGELVVAGQRAVRQDGGQRNRLAARRIGLVRHTSIDGDRVGLQGGHAGDAYRLGGHLEGRNAIAFRERHGGYRIPEYRVVGNQCALGQDNCRRNDFTAGCLIFVYGCSRSSHGIEIQHPNTSYGYIFRRHHKLDYTRTIFCKHSFGRGTPVNLVI